jgi:hypothetical protein
MGDECLVTCGDRTVDGQIVMISDNQISAFIQFEAIFGGHVGLMPVMAESAADAARGVYRSIVNGTEVTLSRKQ